MDYCDIVVYWGYGHMDPVIITTSVETLDGLWLYCYTGCMLGRAPRTKETSSDFFCKYGSR